MLALSVSMALAASVPNQPGLQTWLSAKNIGTATPSVAITASAGGPVSVAANVSRISRQPIHPENPAKKLLTV